MQRLRLLTDRQRELMLVWMAAAEKLPSSRCFCCHQVPASNPSMSGALAKLCWRYISSRLAEPLSSSVQLLLSNMRDRYTDSHRGRSCGPYLCRDGDILDVIQRYREEAGLCCRHADLAVRWLPKQAQRAQHRARHKALRTCTQLCVLMRAILFEGLAASASQIPLPGCNLCRSLCPPARDASVIMECPHKAIPAPTLHLP